MQESKDDDDESYQSPSLPEGEEYLNNPIAKKFINSLLNRGNLPGLQ